MKKKHVVPVVIVLAIGILLITGLTLAESDFVKGRRWRHSNSPLAQLIRGNIGRLITLHAELDVTDEQRMEIKGIIEKHRPDIQPVAKTIVEKKRVLHDAVLAEKPDEDEIRKAGNNLGKAIGDVAVLASEIAKEIRPVFTEEQIELIEKSKEERKESVDKWLEDIVK
jgi:Spy/CpxP family protein refolding chaperone